MRLLNMIVQMTAVDFVNRAGRRRNFCGSNNFSILHMPAGLALFIAGTILTVVIDKFSAG